MRTPDTSQDYCHCLLHCPLSRLAWARPSAHKGAAGGRQLSRSSSSSSSRSPIDFHFPFRANAVKAQATSQAAPACAFLYLFCLPNAKSNKHWKSHAGHFHYNKWQTLQICKFATSCCMLIDFYVQRVIRFPSQLCQVSAAGAGSGNVEAKIRHWLNCHPAVINYARHLVAIMWNVSYPGGQILQMQFEVR